MGRNAAINRVRELLIAFLVSLHDRRGMDAGRGAKRVAPDHRIIGRFTVCVAFDTASEYFFRFERS